MIVVIYLMVPGAGIELIRYRLVTKGFTKLLRSTGTVSGTIWSSFESNIKLLKLESVWILNWLDAWTYSILRWDLTYSKQELIQVILHILNL